MIKTIAIITSIGVTIAYIITMLVVLIKDYIKLKREADADTLEALDTLENMLTLAELGMRYEEVEALKIAIKKLKED